METEGDTTPLNMKNIGGPSKSSEDETYKLSDIEDIEKDIDTDESNVNITQDDLKLEDFDLEDDDSSQNYPPQERNPSGVSGVSDVTDDNLYTQVTRDNIDESLIPEVPEQYNISEKGLSGNVIQEYDDTVASNRTQSTKRSIDLDEINENKKKREDTNNPSRSGTGGGLFSWLTGGSNNSSVVKRNINGTTRHFRFKDSNNGGGKNKTRKVREWRW
jgi:hypothetical protein